MAKRVLVVLSAAPVALLGCHSSSETDLLGGAACGGELGHLARGELETTFSDVRIVSTTLASR